MEFHKRLDGIESACLVWNPDLVPVIAEHLPPNVVACSLRLVNKETSALFNGHNKVDLSQHVPEPAFAWYFRSSDTLRKLSRHQRFRVLSAVAVSGSLANLKLMLRCTIHYLTGEDVDPDEVPGHRLWSVLQSYGGHEHRAVHSLLELSASGGHHEVCRWLLSRGYPMDREEAALAAARGGHLGLMEELRGDSPVDPAWLIEAVAEGCSLPDLTRLYQQELQGREGDLGPRDMAYILAAAAASPTPDWQAKVSWLEAQWQGRLDLFRLGEVANKVATSRLADTVERLDWLRGRGYPLEESVFTRFLQGTSTGDTSVLTYLIDALGIPSDGGVTRAAAEKGHLAALQLLHARGCPVDVLWALSRAMEGGHVAVVSWLVETFGVGDEQLRGRIEAAVVSCSLPLLRWLHERGCYLAGVLHVMDALNAGCSEEVLEWLVEHGCPVQTDWILLKPLYLPMRRCLHRRGWRPEHQG